MNTNTTSVSHMLTPNVLTVCYSGKTHMILRSDPLFERCKQEIQRGNMEGLVKAIDRAEAIKSWSNGRFQVQNGVCMLDGTPIRGELANRIVGFMGEDMPIEPLVKFAEKVRKNPSSRAVMDLFVFLETNNHPITESGNFIAYKRVHAKNEKGQYLDIHSKTMDNRPGAELSMPRNEVDDDPTRTCSHGLHVANWHYAAEQYAGGTGVMLEVEVDPADVVAIPTDYDQAKMRVCRYVVRGEVQNPNDNKLLVTEPDDANDGLDDSSDESEEEESDDDGDAGCCDDCGRSLTSLGECPVCDEEFQESDEEDCCDECGHGSLTVDENGLCESCAEEASGWNGQLEEEEDVSENSPQCSGPAFQGEQTEQDDEAWARQYFAPGEMNMDRVVDESGALVNLEGDEDPSGAQG